MKIILCFLMGSFSVLAQISPTKPTPKEIRHAIIWHTNAVFSDTVNEGEVNAQVDANQVDCISQIVNSSKKTYRHFCNLTILITDQTSDGNQECQTECQINFFSTGMNSKNLDYNNSQMNSCLEMISSACD